MSVILQDATGEIIDAAIKIHKALGPGWFESVYEEVMTYEVSNRGMMAERQVDIPVQYEGLKMDAGFRADLLINREVIIEIKSVEGVKPVFKNR
jgi:GxxExxY protein